MKKYRDFQSQKDERNPETTLDFLSQGKSSKYPWWMEGLKQYKYKNLFNVIISRSQANTKIDIQLIIVLQALGTS